MGQSMAQFAATIDVDKYNARVRAGKQKAKPATAEPQRNTIQMHGNPAPHATCFCAEFCDCYCDVCLLARRPKIAKMPTPAKQARIINSPESKLNKTEARFKLEWLDVWIHEGAIDRLCRHESYKLPCGAGTWLAPDFPTWKDGRLTCYEVKGAFIREDAIAKLKACATINPEITFYLCQWKKRQWIIQKVEP